MPEIRDSLEQLEQRDRHAGEELLPLVYEALRKLAAARMAREPAGLTLQPTALVHEVWLRLGGERHRSWRSRAQFFAAAAEGMRRILIDHARRRRAIRHGGEWRRADSDSELAMIASPVADDELLILHEALDALAEQDRRMAELVKCRFFIGLSLEETAEILGISERTARRDWTYARAWLRHEMGRRGRLPQGIPNQVMPTDSP